MNTYDKLLTGERIRKKRLLLGLTQEELAEKIGRAAKYCADIERGSCGMSIETMLMFSNVLGMSLDYMILGISDETEKDTYEDETLAVLDILDRCSPRSRDYALRLLKLFLAAVPD